MLRVALLASALVLGSAGAEAAIYTAPLSGLNENPRNNSGASGFATVSTSGTDLLVDVTWSGLSGPAVAGHLHCCAGPQVNAGVAVPFDLAAVATGSFSQRFDLTLAATYAPAFITESGGTVDLARARLLGALGSGVYVNIHSFAFPAGELRGDLVPRASVPEPASWALLVLGFGVVGVAARRRVVSGATL